MYEKKYKISERKIKIFLSLINNFLQINRNRNN